MFEAKNIIVALLAYSLLSWVVSQLLFSTTSLHTPAFAVLALGYTIYYRFGFGSNRRSNKDARSR